MSFSVADAMRVATATLDARVNNRAKSIAYTLYFGNNNERYEGKFDTFTVKQAINEFRERGGNYKYAFITRKNEDKPLRYFNRDISKKFFSLTRKGRSK